MSVLALTALVAAGAAEATHFATVYPAPPNRPHLDLGPVLLREGARPRSKEDVTRELDIAARELTAAR